MSRAVILHVEDDSNDVVLFEHACRQTGIPVNLQSVSDADAALAYLRGTGNFADREKYPLPHLLLLDLKLPRVSGLDLLLWIRAQKQFRRLPVVVLTASNHELDVQRSYDAGANSYLVKPLGFEALVELIRSIYFYWLTLNERPS